MYSGTDDFERVYHNILEIYRRTGIEAVVKEDLEDAIDHGVLVTKTVRLLCEAAGFAEEPMFRGLAIPIGMGFIKNEKRVWLVPIATSVCFGLFHLGNITVGAGMNAIYQIEQIPLMAAILIHGVVLYVSYLATYLINGWLQSGLIPVLVFTGIFIVGYLVIWAIIYSIINKRTKQLNKALMKSQQES